MEGAGGLAPGTVIGKYRLIGLLGRGGMGEVWAAHDPDLDRRVAVKLLRPTLAADDDARARLQREGRAMARLRHRNVITVHDAAFLDGRGLIAMELIDGDSLAAWLVKKKPPAEIVRVMIDAGRGLAAAHAAGMIHRDFKPHNVLIDRDGRVVVTDFGLARAAEVAGGGDAADDDADAPAPASIDPDAATATPTAAGALDATAAPTDDALAATAAPADDALGETAAATPSPTQSPPSPDALGETAAATPSPTPRSQSRSSRGDLSTTLTETGALLGTPAYMAPEQLRGGAADARSDQYAFCVTAWEAFTGARPFHGKTFDELAAAVHRGEPGSSAGIPRRLRPILDRGMAREPSARWRSMDELLAAITRAWNRPRRLAIAGAALAAVAGVTAIVLATRGDTTTVVAGCGDPEAAIASAWSPAIRAGVAQAVHGTPHGDGVLAYFDRWSETWRGAYRDNCAKPADPDFVARRACLESLRDELGPITSIGAELDPAMFALDDWPRPIAEPGKCQGSPRSLAPAPPVDPSTRAAVGRLRARMLAARPALLARKLDDATANGFITDATATGYPPVVAEAKLIVAMTALGRPSPGTPEVALACTKLGEVMVAADAAGHQPIALEALLRQMDCLGNMRGGDMSVAEIVELYARADALAARVATKYQLAELESFHYELAYIRGAWSAAIAAEQRRGELLAEVGLSTTSTRLLEAHLRIMRHRGDDLAVAKRLITDWLTTATKRSALYLGDLRTIMWYEGRLGEAPPLPDDAVAPDLSDAVTIRVVVRDAAGPVAGAAIAASPDLHADGTRVGMEEVDKAVFAITGTDGTVAMTVARDAVILARRGATTGAAIAPASGSVTIQLVDAGSAHGVVTGQVEYPAEDPVGPAAVARARQLAVAVLTTEVRGHPLAWEAPIGLDGTWQLPAVLIPGHYVLSAQTDSALGDHQARQIGFDVRAGANLAPELAFPAAPKIVELVLRPGLSAITIAFASPSNAPPPRTWPALTARLAAATAITITSPDGATEADADTNGVDGIARLAIADEPVIVCALVDAEQYSGVALYLSVEAGPAPPQCIAVTPTGDVTRALIELHH